MCFNLLEPGKLFKVEASGSVRQFHPLHYPIHQPAIPNETTFAHRDRGRLRAASHRHTAPHPTSTSVQATTVISTIIPLANINPLTGLPVSDPALLERRPMAIKVTKFPRSVRPEWGLSQADNVYNYYIGDQMTRFIGVFYGTDASRVGPVRSAHFDENIIRMYKAIFVFGSADPRCWTPGSSRI